MSMNLWHDLAPGTAESITTIVEINKGSKNKYEIDKKTGLIALDRVLHTSQDYPFDYGFIPQTLWDDGDPLDVVLLTTYPLFPGCLVKVRPVGIMWMIDGGEGDAKLIAVPEEDPRFDHVQDLKDVNPHTLKEMEHYFSTYKQLQKKIVEVKGFDGKDKAMEAFEHGIKLYAEKYGNKASAK
jgi:inorganic pyrophosphatase